MVVLIRLYHVCRLRCRKGRPKEAKELKLQFRTFLDVVRRLRMLIVTPWTLGTRTHKRHASVRLRGAVLPPNGSLIKNLPYP